MHLILASQSPYRRLQLENFGVRFKAVQPKVDESALKLTGPTDLVALTVFLARAKAESLASIYPDAAIIGSDQLVDLDGRRLDKPGSREQAKHQLECLQGRKHRLITSLAVVYCGQSAEFTDLTEIQLRTLDEETIEAYLDRDAPYDCAGSYKIEKAGLGIVERMQTQDPSAILGLPLIGLTKALSSLGIPLTQLWRSK